MSCSTTSTAGTGEKGCQKYPGGYINLLWWTSEQDIAISSLEQKSFTEALIYASSDRMAILKNAQYFEPSTIDAEKSEPDYGAADVLTPSKAVITLKHKDGNTISRTFAALDGETIHVMLGTEKNVIRGERSSYNNLKTTECTVNVLPEIVDGKREYKNIELTFQNNEWLNVKKDVQLGWSLNDLTPLTGVYLYTTTASVGGNCVILATDSDDTLLTGLTVGSLSMWNLTLGAAIVNGSFSDNADGTYTGTSTSGFSDGDIVEARYAGPTSANLKVQIETKEFTAVA